MVEFEFSVDKARRALGALGKGSENIMGNIASRRPDVSIPGERSRPTVSEKTTPSRKTNEMENLWEEIRDLKSRIRRLESAISDGK